MSAASNFSNNHFIKTIHAYKQYEKEIKSHISNSSKLRQWTNEKHWPHVSQLSIHKASTVKLLGY